MSDSARLGSEINMYNWQIFLGTMFILCLMIATTLYSSTPGREDLIRFVLVLGITWPFLMGRYDFLIHRIGVYFVSINDPWEISDVRMFRRFFLFFYDAGSALPILFLFGHAVYRTWLLGYKMTAVGATTLFLLGVGLLIYAPMIHNPLRPTFERK